MKQKPGKRITIYTLFIYIIIFSTSTSTILNRVGLAVVACFGGIYLLSNRLKMKNTPFIKGMFLYGVFAYIAKTYSISPRGVVNTVFSGYISMFIVVFVVTLVVDDENDIKFLLKAFVLAAVVQCIYMLYVYGVDILKAISEGDEQVRLGGEVSNANSVGISFALGYIISLYFFVNEKMLIHRRVYYGVVMIIGFVFGLLSGSRKVLVLLLTGSFALLFLRNIDAKNVIKSAFGVLLAGIVFWIMYDLMSTNSLFSVVNDRFTALIEGLKDKSQLDNSSNVRFQMIRVGWAVFKANPVFGRGLYASYAYFRTYSHNNFIEILMNTGIVGFLIFYYPFAKSAESFIKINKKETLYPLMLVLFLWVLMGGYGMVNYYSKDSMTMMALISLWLSLQRSKNDEKVN